MKKIALILLSVLFLCNMFISGCQKEQVEEDLPKLIEDEFDIKNEEHINWYGRVYFDRINQAMRFDNTISGFEINFFGTTLDAEIVAQGGANGNCWVSIFVDKEKEPEKAIALELQNGRKTYTLVSGLENKLHTVKVLRRTEINHANVSGLISLTTDGNFYTPPKKPERKIDYYGASSMCGFGSIGEKSDLTFTTDTEDGVSAFSYYTSALLNAQSNVFCASGWGLGVNKTSSISAIYNQYTIFNKQEWDFEKYVADAVVINLGYNDQKTFGSSGTAIYAERQAQFKTLLKEFVRKLSMHYPDAYIYVTYGIWAEYQIYDLYDNTIQELNDDGYTKVIAFKLYTPGVREIGSGYHAHWTAHKKMAVELAQDIKERLKW